MWYCILCKKKCCINHVLPFIYGNSFSYSEENKSESTVSSDISVTTIWKISLSISPPQTVWCHWRWSYFEVNGHAAQPAKCTSNSIWKIPIRPSDLPSQNCQMALNVLYVCSSTCTAKELLLRKVFRYLHFSYCNRLLRFQEISWSTASLLHLKAHCLEALTWGSATFRLIDGWWLVDGYV